MSGQAEQPRPFPRALFVILSLSFLLNIAGIGWGLPSWSGWAMDEITPGSVLRGVDLQYKNGWFSKYPPLHYYLLSLGYAPFLLLDQLHLFSIQDNLTVYTWLFLLGRLISVLMGTGIVLLVYWCGCEIFGRRAALWASLITALMGPFVYYAKIANLDVPYVFWFTFSLVFFVRLLKHHRTVDYVLFAVMAVCAVCTKDQAYGLYVLIPIPVILSRYRFFKARQPDVGFWQTIWHKQVLLSVIVAVFLFGLIHNVITNFSGFLSHFKMIMGSASTDFQIYPNSLAGHARMFWRAVHYLLFLFGWPAFIVCACGLVSELVSRKKNRLLLSLLVPAISYYLFFISVVLYHYDRFLIPIAIIGSLFGGKFLADWLRPGARFTRLRWAVTVVFVGYSLWYAASVDLQMIRDSRYQVERWMAKHIDREEHIATTSFWECMPRTTAFRRVELIFLPSAQKIVASQPEYLIVNPAISFGRTDFYDRFRLAEMGYVLAFKHRSTTKCTWLHPEIFMVNGEERVRSNLDKINPEIRVYRLVDKAALTRYTATE